MKLYQNHSKPDRLILNQRTKSYIPISYIMLLKGKANYTIFVLNDGREKVVAHTLKYFESFLLTHGFQRVHRASMINPKFVKSYNEVTKVITLTNEMSVQISRRRNENFMSNLREKSIKFEELESGIKG
jgi:DNA-binding LytR/AlgR family response regulator